MKNVHFHIFNVQKKPLINLSLVTKYVLPFCCKRIIIISSSSSSIIIVIINEMSTNYRCVRFVNLSMSSLDVFSDECSTFLDMMNDIGIDKKQQRYIIKKMINIAIRVTYYIFCCRNGNWDSPDLMQF